MIRQSNTVTFLILAIFLAICAAVNLNAIGYGGHPHDVKYLKYIGIFDIIGTFVAAALSLCCVFSRKEGK